MKSVVNFVVAIDTGTVYEGCERYLNGLRETERGVTGSGFLLIVKLDLATRH